MLLIIPLPGAGIASSIYSPIQMSFCATSISILAVVRVTVEKETPGTVEVLCTAIGAQSIQWLLYAPAHNFRLTASSDIVESSASQDVVLHQGLTLRSSRTGPSRIESRVFFDSSFPLGGSVSCFCTGHGKFRPSTAGAVVSVIPSDSNPSDFTWKLFCQTAKKRGDSSFSPIHSIATSIKHQQLLY